QVLCALHFYATGSYQGQVASDRNLAVHQITVSACVRAVATAIVRCFGSRWIAFPDTAEERAATQEAFLHHGSLPGVVGCVDGTFIAIKRPSKYGPTVTNALYWCRKLCYALNVMVVSDADLHILAIDPRMPGTTHDLCGGVRGCARSASLANLSGTMSTCLVSDPLEPLLMTPVPWWPALGTSAGQYNQAHASMRAVVERCIGLLKSSFRCLQRHWTLYHHPKVAGTIVVACAVLHNVCL
ncbi:unnamed protein product, partial [Ixodes pacificus]